MRKQRTEVGISSMAAEWTDPNGHHWVVETFWSAIDGRQECVGIVLRSFSYTNEKDGKGTPVREAEGVHPLRVEVLRALTMGVVEESRRRYVTFLDHELGTDGHIAGDRAKAAALSVTFKAGREKRITGVDGQPLPTADALAEVARVYREAWESVEGDRRSPTMAVAERFNLSRSATAQRVARARSAGLLPPTTHGRAFAGKGATS